MTPDLEYMRTSDLSLTGCSRGTPWAQIAGPGTGPSSADDQSFQPVKVIDIGITGRGGDCQVGAAVKQDL